MSIPHIALRILMEAPAHGTEAYDAARAAGASAYLWKCAAESGRELAECIERLLDGDARGSR